MKNPYLGSIIATISLAIIFLIGMNTCWFKRDILGIVLALSSFFIIFYLALTTNILKEKITVKQKKPPYSFSRFQLWLWTSVIVPCFCLNWGFADNNEPTLNTTSLILLGISIGTTFTSGVVSNTQEAAKKSNNLPGKLKYENPSKGFWEDLLMDDNGQFSVGRLQQLVFTLIYVVIYLTTFIRYEMKVYPDFGEQAFYLLGISAGGYLFLKGGHK